MREPPRELIPLPTQIALRTACQPLGPSLKLLLRRPQVELMRPKRGLLRRKPQICLPHGLGSNMLASTSVLVVVVHDPAIGDRVHDLHAFGAHLAGERLRELADTCAAWESR